MKKYTKFKTQVFSRHPSHNVLRSELPLLPFRSVIRLGSTTASNPKLKRTELNSAKSVKYSSNKRIMKVCFDAFEVKNPDWFIYDDINDLFINCRDTTNVDKDEMPFPLIIKHVNGSRGTGNYMIYNVDELYQFIENKNITKYIFEKYYTYSREYRLHVTKHGCFYTCRKMLKNETPQHLRFQRHDDNCVWIVEENNSFDKPVNWNLIVDDCVKALASLGGDIMAFDVKVQSARKPNGSLRTDPKWIVIESCSAPSFGDITAKKYIEQIPILLKEKNL